MNLDNDLVPQEHYWNQCSLIFFNLKSFEINGFIEDIALVYHHYKILVWEAMNE